MHKFLIDLKASSKAERTLLSASFALLAIAIGLKQYGLV